MIISTHKTLSFIWLAIFLSALIWSGIRPKDYFIWALEVAPAIIALAILIVSRHSFRLTGLVYWLILIHAIILMVGGHFTYAEVPWPEILNDTLGNERNNYDKLGHFAQGFIPAMVAREILIRRSPLLVGKWLFFIIVCICLAISAFYELIEWWIALTSETAADAFLGTQGYIWDTQSDMAYALTGAIVALLLLGKIHDRQLESLGSL